MKKIFLLALFLSSSAALATPVKLLCNVGKTQLTYEFDAEAGTLDGHHSGDKVTNADGATVEYMILVPDLAVRFWRPEKKAETIRIRRETGKVKVFNNISFDTDTGECSVFAIPTENSANQK